jgi:hypothetical protein
VAQRAERRLALGVAVRDLAAASARRDARQRELGVRAEHAPKPPRRRRGAERALLAHDVDGAHFYFFSFGFLLVFAGRGPVFFVFFLLRLYSPDSI